MRECNAGTKTSQEDKAGTSKVSKIDIATSQFSLIQVIKEKINILRNSASFIGLVFTFQSNLVMQTGVH